jgi:hypothetical protein
MAQGAEPDSRLLDSLYRGATDVNGFQDALTRLADHFACKAGALLSLDKHTPAASLILTSGHFATLAREYQEYAMVDPAPAAFARLPVGVAATTDQIMTAAQRRTCVFLNEFFSPKGFVETLGGNIMLDQSRFSLIGLLRGKDRPEFSEGEVGALERLMPHIGRALQLRRAFSRLEVKAAGLQHALDRLEAGVLLLDGGGEALFANKTMRMLTQRGDGFALDRAGRPLPASLDARRKIEAMIRVVGDGGAGGIVSVPRAEGARAYAVLISPSPSTLAELPWDRAGRAGVLILVHDPDSGLRAAPDILEQSLNLPPGAARLVAALAGADDLKSFAEREGVTIHTARFHLRTALTRTGTRSQSELVRIAVRLLRDFALRQNGG